MFWELATNPLNKEVTVWGRTLSLTIVLTVGPVWMFARWMLSAKRANYMLSTNPLVPIAAHAMKSVRLTQSSGIDRCYFRMVLNSRRLDGHAEPLMFLLRGSFLTDCKSKLFVEETAQAHQRFTDVVHGIGI